MGLKKEGYNVDAIAPQAAIYLTVQIDLKGKKKKNGKKLDTTKDVTKYILEDAKVAIVPFYAFGDSDDSTWYRVSVGTCNTKDIDKIIEALRKSLKKLA
jgi:aspartate aminotransferase